MADIFDFRHTRMSDSNPASLFVLADPKNMGTTVEISLLSCIEAEIYAISFLLPVNGSHLWFPTYTDVGQSSHKSLRVARPRNYGCSRWNFVAIMYINWDTWNYIFSAAILDFWLPVSSGSVTDSAIEKFDPENIGVAVGIWFLASLEAEIHLGGSFSPPPFNTNVSKITFNIWGLKARQTNNFNQKIKVAQPPFVP